MITDDFFRRPLVKTQQYVYVMLPISDVCHSYVELAYYHKKLQRECRPIALISPIWLEMVFYHVTFRAFTYL